jgi:hypothetical protein
MKFELYYIPVWILISFVNLIILGIREYIEYGIYKITLKEFITILLLGPIFSVLLICELILRLPWDRYIFIIERKK